ncbi:TBC1 domain family member 16-like isoform X1 [Hydractinia symbiolongicarpus]|uniref:TBC1 domain family member 16-like isoform X1 n=1 Tax=Hydractinia symbiolongicarpus TaxID=13093 RepID=UPI00254B2CC3|nr:TBC1 domain family member 16-like isoform X1 [Hydractinia symbiolongicarpus]
MLQFISHTVDKFFNQIYHGEPLRRKHRSDLDEAILEEEVLFCKNNVCVHTPSLLTKDEQHSPGYLCLKKIYRTDVEISDLMLNWIPNALLAAGSTDEAELMTVPLKPKADFPLELREEKEGSVDVVSTEVAGKNSPPHALHNPDNRVNLLHSSNYQIRNFEPPLGGVFSINIRDMKTIKLFYTNSGKDSGQFVIGSSENQYKVFHFHSNGLLKLTEILDNWNGCVMDKDLLAYEVSQQVYYVSAEEQPVSENWPEMHPEEGRYKPMNMINWLSYVNRLGQIEDVYNFKKHVFFGSLSQEVRPDAWKFLMYYYPMHSTEKERAVIKLEKAKSYEVIHTKRLSLKGEEYENFWKLSQFTVDKDVVRTDRAHPYYAGQDNPNIQKMRNILLNYAVYNPVMGYTQGMSDLIAPLLATLHDEVDSFWCFVGLMESSMFATSPKDDSMDMSLGYLCELLRIMLPEFYMHCLCQDSDLSMLFAHRWLVLCFKREFIYHEVLKIWEACWSRYQTDYFHIFICVALVSLYGNICLEKKQGADEMLQYFTDMAMKFDGSAVLKEARALLYKFRQLNRIPCTLRGLLSDKGVWDGGIFPEIECASSHQRCCFGYRKQCNFLLMCSLLVQLCNC